MKYLFWRGTSLWCRFPAVGKPDAYPLGLYTTGSISDKRKCMAAGEQRLAEIRAGRFFEKQLETEELYRPKYWRLVARYWWNYFRFTKSGRLEWFSIRHSLRVFGLKFYDEIDNADVEKWRSGLIKNGMSKGMAKNCFAYMQAVYNHARNETNRRYKISYNPCENLKPMRGSDPRQFLLTPAKFERNYQELLKINPDFAFFYLLLWETGRRPLEAASYRLEFLDWETREIRIPSDISKTERAEILPLSDRIWQEIRARYSPGDNTGLICKSRLGAPWIYRSAGRRRSLVNSTKRWMKIIRAKYGQDAGWLRDTRGGFVSLMCEREDAFLVGSLSGHSDPRSVQRYDKRTRDRLRKAINNRPAPLPDQTVAGNNVLEFRKAAAL